MSYNRFHNNHNNEDYYEEDGYGYSREDIDDVYRGAFEGNTDAYWNID